MEESQLTGVVRALYNTLGQKLTMQELTRMSKREEHRKDDNCAPVAFALHKAIRIRIYIKLYMQV